ncbi:MAG: hypothetical protein L3J28_12045 [Candidatus Polarisedimenticolaceae bacterium]|nr:hypothetical protein [Candidatus Polarisedimenticolaceae bacterium]
MIHRLIITWLVISILGYGMVFAADTHFGESPIDQVAVLDDTHNIPSDDPHDLSANDHCSHGSFHLLGLNFTPAKPSACSTHSTKSAYFVSWNSFLDSPPARPPKA